MSNDDERQEIIRDFRAFADLLEADATVPTPIREHTIWAFLREGERTETERFNAIHNFADAHGLEVTEDHKRARRTEKRFGCLRLIVHAYADDYVPNDERRTVARPGMPKGGAR